MYSDTCTYYKKVCLDNTDCLKCKLFLECCIPIPNGIGYAESSELDCYLCPGCIQSKCTLKQLINE